MNKFPSRLNTLNHSSLSGGIGENKLCRYLELKAIPEEQRSAREHILMLAFEKFYKDREEMEALRKSRDTSRFVSQYLVNLQHQCKQL
jgi:hypothetical protein